MIYVPVQLWRRLPAVGNPVQFPGNLRLVVSLPAGITHIGRYSQRNTFPICFLDFHLGVFINQFALAEITTVR